MNIKLFGLVAVLASALIVTGCKNTAEGVAEDANNAGQTVANSASAAVNGVSNAGQAVANGASAVVNGASNVASNAGQAVANGASAAVNGVANAGQVVANGAAAAVNGASNAVTAAPVTAKVKLAITANPDLGSANAGNKIDVDTKDGKVILRGTASSEANKKLAQTIAEKVITDNKYTETVVNQLTVAGK